MVLAADVHDDAGGERLVLAGAVTGGVEGLGGLGVGVTVEEPIELGDGVGAGLAGLPGVGGIATTRLWVCPPRKRTCRYASAWAWRPQVALFVSEATLFPILMPLAPAATLLARFPDGLAQALAAHDVPEAFITQELSRMQDVRLGKTASRSVLGIMNEFTFLAQTMRGDTTTDLTDLARWLARTPCSPLFKRHGSPDRELRALVEAADQETPTR